MNFAATGLLASIPSPSNNGFSIGPIFFHAYGIMYVLAVAAAIFITRWRWTKPRWRPEPALRGRDLGVPWRTDRRSHLLRHPPPRARSRITGGGCSRSGTAVSASGAGSSAGCWSDSGSYIGASARTSVAGSWTSWARRCWSHRRSAGSATTSTRSCSASRRACRGRCGSRLHTAAGYARFATFEPTFLYEFVWDLGLAAFLMWLWTRRVVRAPGLFALYVAGYSGFRVFEETQRMDFSNHFLGEGGQLLDRVVPVPGAGWSVRDHPARPVGPRL